MRKKSKPKTNKTLDVQLDQLTSLPFHLLARASTTSTDAQPAQKQPFNRTRLEDLPSTDYRLQKRGKDKLTFSSSPPFYYTSIEANRSDLEATWRWSELLCLRNCEEINLPLICKRSDRRATLWWRGQSGAEGLWSSHNTSVLPKNRIYLWIIKDEGEEEEEEADLSLSLPL